MTPHDVRFFNRVQRLCNDAGFVLDIESREDFVLRRDVSKYPEYVEKNSISRFETISAVYAYVSGWMDSRSFEKLEAKA